ncbi:MAG: zinc ABC transporter substrate-binding protein [Qingshengfaniella sp.]
MNARFLWFVPALALAQAATAEAPAVATDIPPVHALVSRVMEGVGTPALIIQPGASPHAYALRPSDARALQGADAVFWVGPGLTVWLEDPLAALSGKAQTVALINTPGTTTLPFREGATFDAHDHDHGDDHAGHDHGDEMDPHAWLDPENARTWLGVIAETLAGLDPDNAETYRSNATAGRAELTTLIDEIAARVTPVHDRHFIVFHDAYQYFEARFDIAAAGSISLGDASSPSPARIAEIRDKVTELDVRCVFAEPQFNPGLIATVLDGTEAQTGTMDPLGADLTPGAALYPALIEGLANDLVACLQ